MVIFNERAYRRRDRGAVEAHQEQLSHDPIRVSYSQKLLTGNSCPIGLTCPCRPRQEGVGPLRLPCPQSNCFFRSASPAYHARRSWLTCCRRYLLTCLDYLRLMASVRTSWEFHSSVVHGAATDWPPFAQHRYSLFLLIWVLCMLPLEAFTAGFFLFFLLFLLLPAA